MFATSGAAEKTNLPGCCFVVAKPNQRFFRIVQVNVKDVT